MSVTDAEENIAAKETALVAQIAAGDTGTPVAELYRRYGRRLYRYGVQMLGSDGLAEEMVQECLSSCGGRPGGSTSAGQAFRPICS